MIRSRQVSQPHLITACGGSVGTPIEEPDLSPEDHAIINRRVADMLERDSVESLPRVEKDKPRLPSGPKLTDKQLAWNSDHLCENQAANTRACSTSYSTEARMSKASSA